MLRSKFQNYIYFKLIIIEIITNIQQKLTFFFFFFYISSFFLSVESTSSFIYIVLVTNWYHTGDTFVTASSDTAMKAESNCFSILKDTFTPSSLSSLNPNTTRKRALERESEHEEQRGHLLRAALTSLNPSAPQKRSTPLLTTSTPFIYFYSISSVHSQSH